MNITLSNQILDELDISNLLNLATDSTQFKEINTLSGYGHYRLLKYLSFCFNNSLFIDIGHLKGRQHFLWLQTQLIKL